ncbi:MAG: hypothetical protein WAK40_08620 [Thermoplasmata archaeon]
MDAVWLLAPVAALMALVIAALVRWASETRTIVAASVVVFLLAMMVAMFVGTTIYFDDPGTPSLVLGLWAAAALMALSVFPVLAFVVREARAHEVQGVAYAPRRLSDVRGLAVTITLLVLAGELLMGRSFLLADALGSSGRGGPIGPVLVATISSPWFLFPMSLEMALTLLWLRHRLPAALVATLATQSAMMFLAPPALGVRGWLLGSGLATAAAMSLLIAYLLRATYHRSRFGTGVRGYLVRFLLVSALLGLGLALWISSDGLALFAIATVLEMAIFFTAIVVPESFATGAPEPLADAPARNPRDLVAPP